MTLTLAQPVWLLLLLPLGAAMWWWPAPTRWLNIWRMVAIVLVVLAMSSPMVKLPSRHGTVVVVADRSLSMPMQADAQLLEQLRLVAQKMSPRDRLGVVGFGQSIAVERAPDAGPVQPWVQDVARDGSDLSQAIRRAMAMLPAQGPSRLLVLSDGRWTGQDPAAEAGTAASRQVAIDYRYLGRPAANDLAIQRLDLPRSVQTGEAFMMSAWVHAPASQTVRYELWMGQSRLASGSRELSQGVSRLIFRDIAPHPTPGQPVMPTRSYTLRIEADGQDPVPENNIAHGLVAVEGGGGLLVVTESPGQGLARLLTTAGLRVTAITPQQAIWSLQTLSGYQGLLLENVPADAMTMADMQTIAQWVQQSGAGLLMTGGRRSFGPGGYFKSPLDPILPVSMELRQEHRKFSVAIVVALDRSGSMTMPVGGRTKMDLANLGTAQVADMLTPMDEMGVIAVDTTPHVIVPLSPVQSAEAIKSRVLGIQSMGGGIYVYEALSQAAAMIASAKAYTKHIILFADAADAEQPGNYKSLLDQCEAAGITVSVIGLGTEQDADAALLKDIAERGRGRAYFTQDPQALPRLFAQDTFVVARSSFVEEDTAVTLTGGMITLAGRAYGQPPAVGGYNLTYLRDGANLAGVTQDDYHAPLVAAWQAGSGRVAAYMGEVDGRFTGPIAQWNELGDLLASLSRWVVGRHQPLPAEMFVRQVVRRGQYRIELHLDPSRAEMDLLRQPTVAVLAGQPGQLPVSSKLTMDWVSPDVLAVDVPLQSDEVALATVDLGGLSVHTLPPVRLPYSPEFEPVDDQRGLPTLQGLAQATGGRERVDLAGIWDDLGRQPRHEPVAHWVLIVALVMLLLEVLERRSGWVSQAAAQVPGLSRLLRSKAAHGMTQAKGKLDGEDQDRHAKRYRSDARPQSPADQAEPSRPSSPADAPAPPGLADALSQARQRAGKRTGRHE